MGIPCAGEEIADGKDVMPRPAGIGEIRKKTKREEI